jgi:hypothetical protein
LEFNFIVISSASISADVFPRQPLVIEAYSSSFVVSGSLLPVRFPKGPIKEVFEEGALTYLQSWLFQRYFFRHNAGNYPAFLETQNRYADVK